MPACRRRRPSSPWEDGSPTWTGRDQWPYAVLTGADVVNRAIGASYGEVAGIARTVRDYAAGVGPAALGTMLTHATTDNVVNTPEPRGVPSGEARDVARQLIEAVFRRRRHPGAGRRW
ncbi:hypothetical protein ACFYQA_26670 [Streptomyces sp. NPDC005774]|uniref:hypothetical protein n=1 Tax=Streptomyces sp. NPDC005774 TaxID=3364728 RepID=UPI00368E3197